MSHNKNNKGDAQAPQYLPLSEDLANILAEWSDAFNQNDLATATKIYEQGFSQYTRGALDEWKKNYLANAPPQQRFKKIANVPNPFPPQKNCKDYLTSAAADALYPILHVREGANKVGNAPYRKAIWEAFSHCAEVLCSNKIGSSDIPNCILFDLVDEFQYQVWQHTNHSIRQRNKLLSDIALSKLESSASAGAEGAAAATPAAATADAESITGVAAAAYANENKIKLPEFDAVPDVWSYTELYKKFTKYIADSKIEDRLNDIASGKMQASELFVTSTSAKPTISVTARVNAAFGYMCLFGLIRLNVATGDYLGALEIAKKLVWEKTGPALAQSVSRAHTAVVHNIGAALMMTRRFSDAVSVLLQGLSYPSTPFRRYHESAQIQVWGLTQICSVLADVSIPDYNDRFASITSKAAVAKGQQASSEDITIPMSQGDMQTFKDAFVSAMPKYIAVGYDLATPVEKTKAVISEINPQDILEVQLRMFLREVHQNLIAIQMRGAIRVYSAFPASKVNELSLGGREATATAAQALQQLTATSTAASTAANVEEQQANNKTQQDKPADLTAADAASLLVNIKTKSLQTCEYKTNSLNPSLTVPVVSSSSNNSSSSVVKCSATVDFQADAGQINVCRYKEVTTVGVRLMNRVLGIKQ